MQLSEAQGWDLWREVKETQGSGKRGSIQSRVTLYFASARWDLETPGIGEESTRGRERG